MDSLCNCPCWVSSNVINSQVHSEDKDTGPLLPVTVCTGFLSSRGSLATPQTHSPGSAQ